jgi:hypothetical protein
MSYRSPRAAFWNIAKCVAAVMLVALVFWVVGRGKVPQSSAAPASGVPIGLPAVSTSGVFDPSLADTPSGMRAWASYSAVDPSPHWPSKNTRTMTTRLAYSDDRGTTWHDLGAVINPISETAGGPEQRTWSNEVSSLVFDPAAPPDAQWKLFWHHYSAIGEDRQFQHGWIAYKHAATPEGLRGASEIKLFGAKAYDSVNDDRSGSTGSPVAGEPRIRVASLGEASDCIALSEPGAMATAGGIYMAVGCYSFHLIPPGISGRIILLKCAAPCAPENEGAWRMIGTLLSDSDASSLGANGVSAADLFMQGDKAYLMVSPIGSRPVSGAYQGCDVFQFSDLDSGKLERAGGKLRIAKEIQGTPGSFNGACTYAQNVTAAGFLYSEIKFSDRPIFQIYKTGEQM